LTRVRPDARIISLETSITRRGAFVPKGINYRMSPENAVSLVSADIDCCVLTNNLISIGHAGLFDTLESRACLRIESAGAGLDIDQASEPAALDLCQSSVHQEPAACSGFGPPTLSSPIYPPE